MHGMSRKFVTAKSPETRSTETRITALPGPHFADWNLLRSFLAIYETGTLTSAARRLDTTQPTTGRHLRELEAMLEETLFVRLPGRLRPNERAHALYEAAAPMRQATREAARLFTDGRHDIAGAVRLSVSEGYGYHVVPQLLTPLLQLHPELEIELAVSNSSDNLLRRDADIAIRHFRPQQDDLVVRKVGDVELGLFAHDDYIARFGEPVDFDFPTGALIAGFDREPMPLAAALHGVKPPGPLRFRWRSDSVLALQAAVECGTALGMYFVDVAAGRPGLRRVLADRVSLKQEVWLCAHDELRRSRRMRLVWDWLGNKLEARFAK
jgi:DNA-binding transcriptional LysR family regulator